MIGDPCTFEPVPGSTSGKVACSVCRTIGNAPDDPWRLRLWQETHRRGHLPCRWCGARLVVKLDGTERIHGRCPKKPHYDGRHRGD